MIGIAPQNTKIMGQNQPLSSWEHGGEITHSTWLYLISTKADIKRNIESFANLVENQFNCKIKILWSDNGGNSTWKISFILKESFTKLALSKHPNKMGL